MKNNWKEIFSRIFKKKDSGQKRGLVCVDCQEEKYGKYCNFCERETQNKYTLEINESIKHTDSVSVCVRRGDQSVMLFISFFNILLAIIISIIAFSEIDFIVKIMLVIIVTILLAHLCFFGDGFRNHVVGFFDKIKNHEEKF